jgi:molecular chaperone GrpE
MADEVEIPVKVVDRRRWAHGEEAAADPSPRLKPTYVEELELRAANAEKQAQEYVAKYRQASHEFEDARARMRKELAKDAERNRRDVLVSLLDVVDNLDRAIEAAKTAPRPSSGQTGTDAGDVLLQGVEMVKQQFLSKLEGFGVKRIETLGLDFDPLLHEAVTSVPAPDASSDGRVLGVITHGYRIGDEVLRPALVAVGKTTTSA